MTSTSAPFARIRRWAVVGALAGTALIAVACGSGSATPGSGSTGAASTATVAPGVAALTGTVQIDGSSTVHPLTEAVAEEFNGAVPRVQVPVGVSGTGGGFSRFCAGETDISNASRPIKTGADSESAKCEATGISYIELPVAYDGLSVVVHPSNNWAACMTVAELKTMWEPEAEGKIRRWNQIRPEWPDAPIELYGPGTDSGTFDYFTEAINGKSGAVRTDFTPSEDDNVLVQGVAGSPNAIGFFGLAYLEENSSIIKGVEIDGGGGCVAPTAQTVESGEYAPLSRALFVYVKTTAAERPEVAAFVDFYLAHAGALATDVGYVTFPPSFYEVIRARWEARETGSIFSGVHGSVGSILGVN
jgi:phosphate transport system substrate-binding protein